MIWIYRILALVLTGFVLWNMVRERRLGMQIAAAMVLGPLVLRILLIK